jgi:opacity protein-like surface antigen
MKRSLIIIAVFVICGALAAPAEAGEPGWHLRVFAAGFDPDLDEMVPAENPDEVRVQGATDLGFGASLEYQFSDRFGLEFGLFTASPDVEISAEIPDYGLLVLTDSMSARGMILDVNLHLTPNSPSLDFFIGGGVASMNYGDLHYTDPDGDPLDLGVGNDTSWTVKAGVDIALGKNSNWAAVGGLRYIDSEIEVANLNDDADASQTFSYNIFSFTVGIAYSF